MVYDHASHEEVAPLGHFFILLCLMLFLARPVKSNSLSSSSLEGMTG